MKKNPALIVTYHPHPEFYQNLDIFFQELEQVIVIDNGSGPATHARLKAEAEKRKPFLKLILNKKNLGVATALNQGFQWAISQGYEQIFAFDQDSSPSNGALFALQNFFDTYPNRQEISIVSSVPRDLQVGVQARFLRKKKGIMFERVACKGKNLTDISFTITSGALYNLNVYRKLGPFQDDFFIDYVDTEYCLRANQAGYKIIAVCNAHLEHRLGEREKRQLLGREHYPTFHSPLRWYYISRNRIPMLKKYALRFPHWFFFEIISGSYILLRMLLFENRKTKKLHAFILGTFDGLRGRMGKANELIEKTLK